MVPSLLLLQSIVPRYPSPIPGPRYIRAYSASPTPSSTSNSSTNRIHTVVSPTVLEVRTDVDLESFSLHPSYRRCIRSPSVCDQELWEVGSWCSSPRSATFPPLPDTGTVGRATMLMSPGAWKDCGATAFMPAGGSTGHALFRPVAAPASQLAADMLNPSRGLKNVPSGPIRSRAPMGQASHADAHLTAHTSCSPVSIQHGSQQQILAHVGAEEGQALHASLPATEVEPLAVSSDSRLIACPFYKWRPEKFSAAEYRACVRGFQDIHYLKDHIKAKHLGPSVCLRCKAEFENELAADLHLENEDCPRGYNQSFVDEHFILSRAVRNRIFEKKSRKEDNEMCWDKIWHLIFPGEPRPADIFVPEDADAILDDVQKKYPGSERAALAEVQKQVRAQLRGPGSRVVKRKKNTGKRVTAQEMPQSSTPANRHSSGGSMLPSEVVKINGTMQSAAHVYGYPPSRDDQRASTLDVSSTNGVSSGGLAYEWYAYPDHNAVSMPPNQIPAIPTPTSLTSHGRASPQGSALMPIGFPWQEMSKPVQFSPPFDHIPISRNSVHRTTGLSESDARLQQSFDSQPSQQYFPPSSGFAAAATSYPHNPSQLEMHPSYHDPSWDMSASPSHSHASNPRHIVNHVQFPPQSLNASRRWAPYPDYYAGAGSPYQNTPQ